MGLSPLDTAISDRSSVRTTRTDPLYYGLPERESSSLRNSLEPSASLLFGSSSPVMASFALSSSPLSSSLPASLADVVSPSGSDLGATGASDPPTPPASRPLVGLPLPEPPSNPPALAAPPVASTPDAIPCRPPPVAVADVRSASSCCARSARSRRLLRLPLGREHPAPLTRQPHASIELSYSSSSASS